MCVSPIKIPNPNYHNTTELIRLTTDTENQYMYVPCNVCSECLMKRQSDVVQRARSLALDHYIFFCTLTYNKESLPVYECSNGYKIPYADKADIQKMFKRIRKANSFGRSFLYYFVTERGSERGRPHVHGLIFIPKSKEDDKLFPSQLEATVRKTIFREWRRNYGSNRNPIWKPLFTYRSKIVGGKIFRNFDCHYCVSHSTDKGLDDVAFYVTKYVLKPSNKEIRLQQALRLNLDEYEFETVWSIVKSRSVCSKGFGSRTDLEESYVKQCIAKSRNDPSGLKYYSSDGSSSPLSRYYRKFVSAEDMILSVRARGGPLAIRERSMQEKIQSVDSGNNVLSKARKRDISEFYPE